MRAAASNEGGAMAGFVGLGMAQQAGGVNAAGLYQMGAAPAPKPAPESAENTWKCSCGTENTANFCSECGKKRPDAPLGWTCECGTLNKGRFCINCGKKKPDDQPLYACDKCGWEPEDPHHPPKFCPECGDPFDDSDIR